MESIYSLLFGLLSTLKVYPSLLRNGFFSIKAKKQIYLFFRLKKRIYLPDMVATRTSKSKLLLEAQTQVVHAACPKRNGPK